ncbi:MAG: hypothetical protein NT129_04280 [Candidatus Aenigmarchaeota archaeon]|nr:hypothetical protein [Candidatus Aenigmarchaeota archaeon]
MDAFTCCMVGKRFSASDLSDLKKQLSEYGLLANLDERGYGSFNARRLSDQENFDRYSMVPSHNNNDESARYDLVVGIQIADTLPVGCNSTIDIDLPTVRKALRKVKKDIPEARLIIASYLD